VNTPLSPAEQAAAEALADTLNGHERGAGNVDCWTAADFTDEARAVVAAVRPAIEEPYARAVAKLATALDQLGGRIYRDLAGDYAEIHTSGDAPKTVDGFNAAAEEFLAVLNDPEVRVVVEAALSRPTSEEH